MPHASRLLVQSTFKQLRAVCRKRFMFHPGRKRSRRSSCRSIMPANSEVFRLQANGIPTTVRKTEVRTTPVRSQECEYQQCEETTVRMRQKCEGQVCEGQECECDFSAIGQNSEVIQIERSRSFCLQDGVFFFSLSLSVSLFLSRVIMVIRYG